MQPPADAVASLPAPSLRREPHPAHAIFAGLAATLVGIALARFAYTPLVPVLIEQHWFAANDVVFLGAANLAGYLVGALVGRPLASRLGNAQVLRWMMATVSLSFLACAFPLSFAWFFGWRLLSGIAGGAIMVLVAATILPHVPAGRKAVASGAVFLGLGLGIAGSGTLIPPLLTVGLKETWMGMAALSAALTAAAWTGWPGTSTPRAGASAGPKDPPRPGLRALYVSYALMAVGLVPPMVFLADHVARGLGLGAHLAAVYWTVYGLGAIAGPVLYAWAIEKAGSRPAVWTILAVQAAAVSALPALHGPVALGIAVFVIGTFPPGVVPLMLNKVAGLMPGDTHAQNATWSKATVVFALSQAVAAYACSWLFKALDGHHATLFWVAGAGMAGALVVEVVGARRTPA